MTIGVNIKRKTSLSQRCFLFLLVATVVEVNQYLTPRSSPGQALPSPDNEEAADKNLRSEHGLNYLIGLNSRSFNNSAYAQNSESR
jgi:hypothetical protein